MKFRVGDKVRFLNESGEGVVRALMANHQVLVETTDGFDMPYTEAQLVHADPQLLQQRREEADRPKEKTFFKKSIREFDEDITETAAYQSEHTGLKSGWYLVFSPKDAREADKSPLLVSLFNYTSLDGFYTFYVKQSDTWVGKASGKVNKSGLVQVDEVKRSDLDNYKKVMVKWLSIQNGPGEPGSSASSEINIKASRFFKENTFTPVFFTDALCLVLPLTALKNNEEQENAPAEEMPLNTAQPKFVTKKNSAQLIDEIDLHIEQLVEDASNMTSAEMLSVQIAAFRKKMDAAIAGHLQTLVVIHGVGNGILRAEIRKSLKHYHGVTFEEANPLKYGNGATKVIFD